MLSLFEVLALDVISECYNILCGTTCTSDLCQKVPLKYSPVWLLLMFGTHLGYPSFDTSSPPGNANQLSPI